MRSRRASDFLKILAAVITMLALGGCDAHREFANIFNSMIGSSADAREQFEYGYLGKAETLRKLPNGNPEYVLDYSRKGREEECKIAMEVEKNSRRIVGWRYLSDPKNCWHRP